MVAMLLVSQAAVAALGDKPLSQGAALPASVKALKSTSIAAAAGYTAQTIELHSGTLVTEFVDTSGTVFAVSWTGPVLPDFGVILGSSVDAFNTQAQTARQAGKRGGTFGFDANGLVVVSAGHMRSFHGFAYLAARVPSGVDIHNLVH